MLLVKTQAKQSKIHGTGVFADQDIHKGQLLWKYSPLIDNKISQKKLSQLPPFVQEFIKYYSYLNDQNQFVLCGDQARYINHSDNPNTEDKKTVWNTLLRREGTTIASKPIKSGEEITSKYLRFDKKGVARHL